MQRTVPATNPAAGRHNTQPTAHSPQPDRQPVVVAMSGGVDSSVAALLLREAGHPVIGMTLKTWPKELCDTVPKGQTCCSRRDIEDARAVAHRLGIPFYVVEAADAFKAGVMGPFVAGYSQGLTPNPCVVCNRLIKCGILLEKARALGARWLATGHYARLTRQPNGRYALRQASDPDKDQTYVLFQLSQEQMASLLLPLGDLSKSEVRDLAQRAGLCVAEKPESMELCFIPDGDTQGFLRARAPEAFEPGPIVDRQGRVLGAHAGIAAYTVGQRKGLRIAHPAALYVLEIQPRERRVVVGEWEALSVRACLVRQPHWMAIPALEGPREVEVKIRYRSRRLPARIEPDGSDVRVEFAEAVEGGVSPGQAAVFYEGDLVLGGGWIAKAVTSDE